jgi:hypothetical protein
MHYGTPGDDFDNLGLEVIRTIKNIFAVLSLFSAGLLALYAGYLALGGIFFIIHVLLR